MTSIQELINHIKLPNDIKSIIKEYLYLSCSYDECNNIIGLDSSYCSDICKSLDIRSLLADFLKANITNTSSGACFKCPSCSEEILLLLMDILNPRRLLLLIWNHITGACCNCVNVNELEYDLIDIGIILDDN
jgi:hypothetical protein